MDPNNDIIIDEDLSSDESDQLSRISDDSGIEDLGDDMTLQAEPMISASEFLMHLTEKKQQQEAGSPPFEETEFVGPKLPEESIDVFPSFPEIPEGADIKRDEQVENGIPGTCGLYNLGNTCFMNAALQCLLAVPALQDIFKMDFSHTPVSASFLKPMIEQLQILHEKVFSGKYCKLQPSTLHSSISNLHPLFGDYKQHDSQEFLSFVLNIIHDFLNLSLAEDKDEAPGNITGEVTKRLKMEHAELEPDAGVECEEETLTKAQIAWRKYFDRNGTIIADRLQGQFQSVITCEKCGFISTTYEPFMFLSLSIPYAMERQIRVTWVPSPKPFGPMGQLSTSRYLVIIKKSGLMKNLKDNFFDVIKKCDDQLNTKNIVFAEVKNSANIRVLDDKTQLQYISKASHIYALEILSLSPKETNIDSLTTDGNGGDDTTTWHSCNICFEEKFAEDLMVHRTCSGMLCSACLQSTISYNQNSVGDFPCPSCNRFISSKEGYEPMTKRPRKDSIDSSADKVPIETDSSQQTWRTCTICLEDTFDEEMRSHLPCGGMICAKCVQITAGFHENSSFPCPTCGESICEADYTKLTICEDDRAPVIRQVLVPILFRYSRHADDDSSKLKLRMFGHPHVTRIPSECSQDKLYQLISIIVERFNVSQDFDILVTDASGLSCGFCEFLSSCYGCDVKDMATIKLKPGCCITLHFKEYFPDIDQTISYFKEDVSMKALRSSDTVTLTECMETFADVEVLTEDNPWYCPNCQMNQVSAKVMSVTRWPETLIIHLKRFHFEDTQGSKISCPIDFPLSDLNVDLLSCLDTLKGGTLYDLYGCVNHTGSLFGGHYTAFAKQGDLDWYYFNDSSFNKLSPTEDADHQTEAYVLFYKIKES